MSTATFKQINFLSSLLTEAEAGLAAAAEQGAADILAAVTEALTPDIAAVMQAVRQGSQDIDGRAASAAIDALLKRINPLLRPLTAVALPVGLAALKAERVIVNKYAKACTVCGSKVAAFAGHAAKVNGSWITVCAVCAETDPAIAQREAEERRAAERAEAQAKHEAERAEREARRAAEAGVRSDLVAFGIDFFDRAGVAEAKRPDVHVAIPSATGNNDLDFFRIVSRGARMAPLVSRVIGGRSDQVLAVTEAHAAMLRLVLTEDLAEAMAAYGREIGRCGYCHKRLTDEDSRALGLGPVCAGRLGR